MESIVELSQQQDCLNGCTTLLKMLLVCSSSNWVKLALTFLPNRATHVQSCNVVNNITNAVLQPIC